MGGSNGHVLYDGLENGDYPFISTLRENGFDVVLLGFNDRSASILDNADVAIECIRRTVADREGDAMLTVGGFSMGGMVTRYALAKMERQREDHQTATYLSYDTPHRGAWLPLGVQAFAHFVKEHWGNTDPLLSLYSDLVNSSAARQMLRWHVETGTEVTLDVAAGQDQARTDFLEALQRVGDWPMRPRLLGVANGTGTGVGNNIPADDTAMAAHGPKANAKLRTQGQGQQTVAQLAEGSQATVSINTTGFPELDGAPGGLSPRHLSWKTPPTSAWLQCWPGWSTSSRRSSPTTPPPSSPPSAPWRRPTSTTTPPSTPRSTSSGASSTTSSAPPPTKATPS
ncbi:esterase/lipase family protein [Streptomyces sp. NPDC002463]|uniref:esterase/lipase family protein n=1 Tax=Streptomyces sp. NPDC002463 TaxID=3364645 RepID=UPI00367E6FA0